jgi:serine/threonine-protein kinase RsbW
VEDVPYARAAMTRLCEHLGFADDLIERVRLTVTEACANCVRHAYEPARPATYVLDARLEHPRFRVAVRDRGLGFRQDEGAEPSGKGSGLWLMRTLSDSIAITSRPDQGTEVVMHYDVVLLDPGRT